MTHISIPQPILPPESFYNELELAYIDDQPPFFPTNQDSNWGLHRQLVCNFLQETADQQALILKNRFIDTAEEFLDDWEDMLGIASNPAYSLSQRRAVVKTRLERQLFTRTRRQEVVEAYVTATVGPAATLGSEGLTLDSSGVSLYSGDLPAGAAYEIREYIDEFRYTVSIPSSITPDITGLRRELKRITPAHINFDIFNTIADWPSAALTTSGGLITDTLRTTNAEGDGRPFCDLEFWAEFESCTTGSVGSDFQTLEAANPATQFVIVTSPSRTGTKTAKFSVASGEVSSSGERSEIVRSSGYGVGTVDHQTVARAFSVQPIGPFPFSPTWNFFHQIHYDSRFNQAGERLQYDPATGNWTWRLVTGNYPTATDALNGTNMSVSLTFQLLPFVEDEWLDIRYVTRYESTGIGWTKVWAKYGSSSTWTLFVDQRNIQTLGTITGDPTPSTIYEKYGIYRGPFASTQQVYYDSVRVGHSVEDLDYTVPTGTIDSTVGIWQGATNLHTNGSVETNTTGWTARSGATLTRVTTDKVFGSACLKVDMPGSASSESAELNIALTNGQAYIWSAWVKVAIGERGRINVVDGVSASLGTFAWTGDGRWRRVAVQFTANANNNHQCRIGRTATGAAQTIYVDGAQLETVTAFVPTPYIHTDGGSASRTAPRVRIPQTYLHMTPTQGFVACFFRVGFDYNQYSSATPYIFRWRVDDSNEIRGRYVGSTAVWEIQRIASGTGATRTFGNQKFRRGDYMLAIFAWDEDEVKLSIDGKPHNVGANTFIPDLSSADFDIGSSIGANNWMNSSVCWMLFGSGNPTDQQASDWMHYGKQDRSPADFAVGDPMIQAIWTADDLNYRHY